MWAYVGRRVASGAIALFGLTLVVFFIVHLVPGDPAVTLLGPRATPEAIATLHREWGLNQPVYDQYEKFMSNLIHGNMGSSLFMFP